VEVYKGRHLWLDGAHALKRVSFDAGPSRWDSLMAAGRAMAEDMLRASPLGLRLTKDGINQNLNAPSLDAAMALEDRQQILCGHTEDVKEAFHAFLEKREPQYKDR
jgi:enoyl-CoA hydratase/carnithine racemase